MEMFIGLAVFFQFSHVLAIFWLFFVQIAGLLTIPKWSVIVQFLFSFAMWFVLYV